MLSVRTAQVNHKLNTWQSVKADVLSRIKSGEWRPGMLIPTEHELARSMGCARATVNRALRDLADSGILERRRKIGTRVASTAMRRTTLEMSVIRQEIEALGAEYGYRLTQYDVKTAPDHVADILQIPRGTDVLTIKAKYSATGKPHCCEIVWLNMADMPDVQRSDLEVMAPHDWLSQKIALTGGQFTILAEGATGECARNLEVEPGTPVLAIERVSWSDLLPVSFARQFYPPGHRLVSEG